MSEYFVDVLLPLPVWRLYTYNVPKLFEKEIGVGKRVIVPFGKHKIYSALIRNIQTYHPDPSSLKEIQSVLDDHPVVNEKQFKLWEWMSEYYMCTQGEVMNSGLPSSLKLQSETKVMAVDFSEKDSIRLTENEEILLSALKEKNEMSIDEISKLLNKSSVHQILKKAFEKNLIIISEEINQRYKPKKIAYLRLAEAFQTDSSLENLFMELEQDNRKARQLESLMIFMKYLFEDPERKSVKKSLVINHNEVSKSSIHSLITNGVLVEFDVIIDRIETTSERLILPLPLSTSQRSAYEKLKESFDTHDVSLLHGVTSSGKTEIYIHLIEKIIQEGRQVLYLLPEIALTTQLIIRLKKYFGEKVGIYHSRYSSNERVEIWNHVLNFDPVLNNRSQIVLGARSSLFLPFKNLGLVIVDEEHDQSYKQSDPAPRYNGRDTAIMLSKIHNGKTVLGSATPSMESYYNAKENRYGLIPLNERHGGMQMPEILIADLREAKRKKLMKSNFTPELLDAVKNALGEKEQVILFQNRRGFANYIECQNCNYIPHCKNCSVTLTYHKLGSILKCHYCGYIENLPSACTNCGDYNLAVKGFGTEQIEEDIAIFFPEARVARMDMDSTRTRKSFQNIIGEFEDRKIDILVGTQMVTKGLDFDNVSLVGIINADQLLNFPDFRAFERSFQLMAQVSGRSGRKQKRGKVIIQTQQPEHWIIRDVVNNNYEKFYERDLMERLKFGYPPHSRLIELTLRSKENEIVHEASEVFTELLKKNLGNRILGPHIPIVSKIRNMFYRNVLVKIERASSPREIKSGIFETFKEFYSNRENLVVQIIPDVDPT
jgi:primosomal protein N' (replication factor Y)